MAAANPQNGFLYALVARGAIPLAEQSTVTDTSFKTIILKYLETINPSDARSETTQGEWNIYAMQEPDRLIFLCLTTPAVSQQLRILFCEEMMRKWRVRYGNSAGSFTAYSKVGEFGGDIMALFRTFNSERGQKLGRIKQNLAEAQEQTTKNITLALERGEKLNEMQDKANTINSSAKRFHREAVKVKNQMFWQKWRWIIIGSLVVAVIVTICILICVYVI